MCVCACVLKIYICIRCSAFSIENVNFALLLMTCFVLLFSSLFSNKWKRREDMF